MIRFAVGGANQDCDRSAHAGDVGGPLRFERLLSLRFLPRSFAGDGPGCRLNLHGALFGGRTAEHSPGGGLLLGIAGTLDGDLTARGTRPGLERGRPGRLRGGTGSNEHGESRDEAIAIEHGLASASGDRC